MFYFTDTLSIPEKVDTIPVELIFESQLDENTHVSIVNNESVVDKKPSERATEGTKNAEFKIIKKNKQQKKEKTPLIKAQKIQKEKTKPVIPIKKIPKLITKPQYIPPKDILKTTQNNIVKKDTFEPKKLAALLNKVDDITRAGKENIELDVEKIKKIVLVDTGNKDISARLTHSQLDLLRAQITRCWNPPIGVKAADKYIASLHIFLGMQGELLQRPISMNKAQSDLEKIFIESAVRAVIQCAPYSLPAENYAVWKELLLNFDPKELLN